MRVICWNVKKSVEAKPATTRLIAELYRGEWRGVICLQEVSHAQAYDIMRCIPNAHIYHACQIWPRSSYKREKWGNLTILKNLSGFNPHVLPFLPHPEKSLVVTTEMNNSIWNIINFHSVTGVGHKEKKGQQYTSLFTYLMAYRQNVILCGDMNEPKEDSANYEAIECWSRSPGNREAAEAVFKGPRTHGMVDAHIEYARAMGSQSLTPTYVNGSTKRRYDHIFVKGHKSIQYFEVRPVDKAISDHWVVRCDLAVSDA